jgi:hypothetical protein
MRRQLIPGLLSMLAVVGLQGALRAQHKAAARPDLQGIWNGSSLTPLQRPAAFEDKAAFTPEEAAEYARTFSERARSRLPTADDRLTQVDVDDTFVETEAIPLDGLRTSLIVDPPTGMLPPLLPAALARASDARLYGVDCHEGNYAIENFLRGARDEERRARTPER